MHGLPPNNIPFFSYLNAVFRSPYPGSLTTF